MKNQSDFEKLVCRVQFLSEDERNKLAFLAKKRVSASIEELQQNHPAEVTLLHSNTSTPAAVLEAHGRSTFVNFDNNTTPLSLSQSSPEPTSSPEETLTIFEHAVLQNRFFKRKWEEVSLEDISGVINDPEIFEQLAKIYAPFLLSIRFAF